MKAIMTTLGLVLLVLAVQAPLPTRARPGTRVARQDLRMLPANSTGTPQDQALAGGIVPQEAAQTPVPTESSTTTMTTPASAPGATTMTTTAASAPAAAGLRRTPLASTVQPASGQERTKHTGIASDFAAEDSNIVFPTPQSKPDASGQPKFDPFARIPSRTTPACAKGSTFCTDVDNYPENYLQTMLRSATVGLGYREYFGNDVIAEGNITQRIDVNDENPLCPYEETVVYPKVAKNKEDKWLYVVNQDHFVQGVRIEQCLNAGTACQLAENFPYGYTTSCRQKYILRKLVALNPEGKTQTDMFRLPSCCSCYVSRALSSRRSNMTPAVKKTGSRKR